MTDALIVIGTVSGGWYFILSDQGMIRTIQTGYGTEAAAIEASEQWVQDHYEPQEQPHE